jgi:uncharacterized zinc-type alcohol dehydrogenase-like protein
MLPVRGYAANTATSPLEPFEFTRRDPGPRDVVIDILYCGVCHSDIHQARNEWDGSIYPMVPGHEIVGSVAERGAQAGRWTIGDVVGVGVFVDSCRECDACESGDEQYCTHEASWTYNGYEQDGSTPTYGGYSTRITVDESYVFKIPGGLPLDGVAPLMCAGITTYSPLRHFGANEGDDVAVVGLGGLGHMGVKFGKAIGTRVSVLSHSPGKREDALKLGADEFISTLSEDDLAAHQGRFDVILDTVSAAHDYNAYLDLLRRNGTMILVGIPDAAPLKAWSLINGRRRLAGSQIGGLQETQEMLDFCARHGIVSDVEVIPIQQINEAWERTVRSDVRYRFVIDNASLGD